MARPDGPILRPAVAKDAPALAAVSIEVWLGTYLRRGVNAFFAEYVLAEFTADRFSAILSSPDEHLFVSQNDQGIDGFVRLSENRQGPLPGCSNLEISTLYVQPRHHGRGLGRALLRQAFDTGRALGADTVWLTTNSENTPAIDFYTRMGFDKIGTTHFRLQDQAYLNDVFTRQINPALDDRPIHR